MTTRQTDLFTKSFYYLHFHKYYHVAIYKKEKKNICGYDFPNTSLTGFESLMHNPNFVTDLLLSIWN